ncbi:HNH endonuclease signature motif containing protein [Lysinibacillus sp. Bpr_S20]|uniref:HNH endonuclease n=1 Tax=Lysinibacillus sp. Bpr_S20 TaxID=2933964 RepID=UPI002012FE03|nr:HNH endonuclease signature motif containing protein [Lysinibacillus sp. Bpr_S20]MCL1702512.1 HNH endonuclease [Lysinibacillus sp. Bpr_S20]
MNSKPLRLCNKPGCPNLTRSGYCEQHKETKSENNRYYDKYQRNKKHDRFYHSASWIKCRDYIKIRDNGLCQHCKTEKRITIGVLVDHIIRLSVDWNKRLDEDNLQLLCQSCHNKKTNEDVQKYGRK